MSVAGRTIEFIAGALIVVGTILSAVRSTILPRAARSRVSTLSTRSVRWVFRKRAGRRSTFEGRDRALAMMAPVALLVLLASWLVLIMIGYTLMYLAVTHRTVSRSIELSGSSVFTLGTTSETRLGPLLLTYTEAGIGLLLLTLLITYLPSIYGAFSRRENGVALLQVRAGVPPRAAAMLIRYRLIEDGGLLRLTELWRQWEAWFADVEETHSSFPILAFFRSPSPDRSWITAAGALLDGASFWAGATEHPKDPDAQLCIRAGYIALRRIADLFHIAYDDNPAPDDPISVDRSEWDAAMDEMEAAGVPVLADREKAWVAWKGWRVNYDTVLLNLARLIDAPPAPWLSDRSPVGAELRRSLRSTVTEVGEGLRRRVQSGRSDETPTS